jgi:hypothetical protein
MLWSASSSQVFRGERVTELVAAGFCPPRTGLNLMNKQLGLSPCRDPGRVRQTHLVTHRGTLVVAVHASFIDTDMAAGSTEPKSNPESVARQAFDASHS